MIYLRTILTVTAILIIAKVALTATIHVPADQLTIQAGIYADAAGTREVPFIKYQSVKNLKGGIACTVLLVEKKSVMIRSAALIVM